GEVVGAVGEAGAAQDLLRDLFGEALLLHRGAAGAQAGRVAAGRGVRRGREGQGGGEDECGRRNAGGRVPDGHAASNSIQVICSTKSGAEGSSIPTVRTSPPRRPFPDAGGPARRPPSGGRGPLDRRPGRRPPSGPSGPERPRAEENTTPPAPRSVIFGWSGAPARAPRLRADRRVRAPDTALRAVPPAPRPAAAASADRAARPSRIRVPAPRSGAALPPRSGGRGDLEKNGEDRKSTRLNSSHVKISYAVFCLKKKKKVTHSRNYCTFI